MKKWHYYSEWDPFAAEWLRNLIKKGLIPDGEVDTRSIVDVRPGDLSGFTQCHWFAGIAGWPLALQLAGWPDDRPIWTGSCPCQPFSVAGKGKGTADERHLWPAFFHLIRECRPSVVIGEQVASKAGREWLSGVLADLEGVGYAGAGADLCAAGVGAPHIRQRLYWVARTVADTERDGTGHFAGAIADEGRRAVEAGPESLRRGDGTRLSGRTDARDQSGMADADSPERWAAAEGRRHDDDRQDARRQEAPGRHQFHRAGDLADADDAGRQGWQLLPERADECSAWSDGVEWRRGADGKERRTKRGILLLVNGISGGVALERTLPGGEKETHIYSRVGALRGFGNAVVPPLAAEFIRAIM